MIDVHLESVVSLNEAAGVLPRRRGGKKPHVSCLYRWTQNGCRGVILESVQIGGTRCTSFEAFSRFFARLSGTAAEGSPTVPTAKFTKRVAAAEQALDKLGI